MLNRICCTFLFFFFVHALSAQSGLYIYPGGNLTIQPGANLIVKGSTYLSNGALILNSGSIHLSNASKTSWTDSSFKTGSVSGTGKTYFDGSAPINVFGKNSFFDVEVSGSNIVIDSPTTFIINHLLNLKKGVIQTNKSILKINSDSATAIEADVNNPGFQLSWIDGSLTRKLTPNFLNYDFPVGDSTGVHLLTLLNENLFGVNEVTTRFGPKDGNDAGLNVQEEFRYTQIHNGGIWYVIADSPVNSGHYNLRLSIRGFAGLSDNQFGILSRPFGSADAREWVAPLGSSLPAAGSNGRTVSSGYAQRNSISNLNAQQFAVGMASSVLPVTLVNFSGKKIGQYIQLTWTTSAESNSESFNIERQNTDNGYLSIGHVKSKAANGVSSQSLVYTFIDSFPYPATNYYRLKELKMIGGFSYSPIISILGESNNVNVFPNPSKGIVYIKLAKKGIYDLTVRDENGKLVKKEKIISGNMLSLSNLPNGYYIINVYDENRVVRLTEKLLLLKD